MTRSLLGRGWRIALCVGVVLAPWGVFAQAPATEVFRSDFELGDLETGEDRVTEARFLREWRQRFHAPEAPLFMEGWLARRSPQGVRHLAIPIKGAGAHFTTIDSFPLSPGQIVRFRAWVRWDTLGESGSWELRLVPATESTSETKTEPKKSPDSERSERESADENGSDSDAERAIEQPALAEIHPDSVVLFSGDGASPEWQQVTGEWVVTDAFQKATLEIRLTGQRGVRGGTLALDEIVLERVPRILWSFRAPLRQIHVEDEYPLTVTSVGYPTDTYDLRFTLVDDSGRALHREKKILLVSDEYPIEFSPRFEWRTLGLRRGLYWVVFHLRARSGWEVEERRAFALTGTPPFVRGPGGVRWGIALDSRTEPGWLPLTDPQRLAIPIDKDTDAMPAWLSRYPVAERIGTLGTDDVPDLAALEKWVTQVRRWMWRDPASARAGKAGFDEWVQRAPFLRAGVILPTGEVQAPYGEPIVRTPTHAASARELLSFPVPDETWSAVLDLSDTPVEDRAIELARRLFLLAFREPVSVLAVNANELFVQRSDAEGMVATSALLVWHYATGFLCGAEPLEEERWDPNGVCLSFRRDDRDYLLVVGDEGAHELKLPSLTAVDVYDATGSRQRVESEELTVRIPVDRGPRLVAGLNLPVVRTLRSIEMQAQSSKDDPRRRTIRVAVTNRMPDAGEVSLALNLPASWSGDSRLPARRLAADERTEWLWDVEVPPWFGIEGPAVVTGTITVRTDDGESLEHPFEIAVDLTSTLIEVEPRSIGAEFAEVVVRNTSDAPLRFNIYLQLRPGSVDRTEVDQVIEPKAERVYRLDYPLAKPAGAELWIGVTVPDRQAFVNRVFEVE